MAEDQTTNVVISVPEPPLLEVRDLKQYFVVDKNLFHSVACHFV